MTTASRVMTTEQVAARYHELAQQGKWFDITAATSPRPSWAAITSRWGGGLMPT